MVAVRVFEAYPTVEDLNETVGRAFLTRLSTFIDKVGADSRVNVAISGGAITTGLLPSLLPFVGDADWSRMRVRLVDERYMPAGSEDRNDDQAWEGFLHAASGVEFTHMLTSDVSAPGAGSLGEAAAAFVDTWRELMGEGSSDIALIGMGSGGHICSFFPGRVDMDEASPILVICDSLKPSPEHVTVSTPVMHASGEVWLTTAGTAKADAPGQAFTGASPLTLPVVDVLSPTARARLDGTMAARVEFA